MMKGKTRHSAHIKCSSGWEMKARHLYYGTCCYNVFYYLKAFFNDFSKRSKVIQPVLWFFIRVSITGGAARTKKISEKFRETKISRGKDLLEQAPIEANPRFIFSQRPFLILITLRGWQNANNARGFRTGLFAQVLGFILEIFRHYSCNFNSQLYIRTQCNEFVFRCLGDKKPQSQTYFHRIMSDYGRISTQ